VGCAGKIFKKNIFEKFSGSREISLTGKIYPEQENFYRNSDALGGSAPAAWAPPGCDDAVLPVHKNAEVSVQVI
jgi:hypothetical protein